MEGHQPFSDLEKRFLLAELLKNSVVPVDRLLSVLREGNIIPQWELIQIPTGRNLKSCKDEFDILCRQAPYQPSYFQGPLAMGGSSTKRKSDPAIFESTLSGPPAKRRQSALDIGTTARDIRPKPANGAPSPLSMTTPAPPEPKKRGRPSKEVLAQRQAEAIAKGEVLAAIAPQVREHMGPGGGSTGTYAMIAPSPPVQASALHSSGPGTPGERREGRIPLEPALGKPLAPSSGRRRRAPKPKTSKKSPNPGESSFSVSQPIAPAPSEPREAPPSEPLQPVPLATVEGAAITLSTPSAASEAQSVPPEPQIQPSPEI